MLKIFIFFILLSSCESRIRVDNIIGNEDKDLKPNTKPIILDINQTVNKNIAVSVDLSANLTDPDLSNIQTYSIISGPSNGAVSSFNSSTGTFTYTPNLNYTGTDTIQVKTNDGYIDSETADVTITLTNTNNAPISEDNSFSINEDTVLSDFVSSSDIDSDALTLAIVSNPSSGVISSFDVNTGAFTYVPNLHYSGSDSFTYRVYDGVSYSATSTVSITIVSINDTPVATDASLETNKNTDISGDLDNFCSDVDSALSYSIVANPSNGTISSFDANTGLFTYTPSLDYVGSDVFTYQCTDGVNTSTTKAITITTKSLSSKIFVSSMYNTNGINIYSIDPLTPTTANLEVTLPASSDYSKRNFRFTNNSFFYCNESSNDHYRYSFLDSSTLSFSHFDNYNCSQAIEVDDDIIQTLHYKYDFSDLSFVKREVSTSITSGKYIKSEDKFLIYLDNSMTYINDVYSLDYADLSIYSNPYTSAFQDLGIKLFGRNMSSGSIESIFFGSNVYISDFDYNFKKCDKDGCSNLLLNTPVVALNTTNLDKQFFMICDEYASDSKESIIVSVDLSGNYLVENSHSSLCHVGESKTYTVTKDYYVRVKSDTSAPNCMTLKVYDRADDSLIKTINISSFVCDGNYSNDFIGIYESNDVIIADPTSNKTISVNIDTEVETDLGISTEDISFFVIK